MNDVSSGGTDKELWSYYGLQRQAQETAVLVAPQGISNGWANSGGEDIQFLDAMIKSIEGALCVDQSQRFSLGFSYGGSSKHYSIHHHSRHGLKQHQVLSLIPGSSDVP